jgi:hypothetical protein
MHTKRNSGIRGATALIVMVATALATVACQTSARDLHYKSDTRFDTQQQAGSAHVAVMSVGSWEDYQSTLQPTFSMDEKTALNSVVPSTQLLRQETQQALSLMLKLRSADLKLSEEQSKTKITDPENPDSNKDEEVEKSSSKTETTDASGLATPKGPALGTPGSLPSRKDVLDGPVDMDPFMRHAAAAALFQEVRLLNRYIRDAATRDGYRALVVRVQVNLMPAARNEPYDAYTTLSFFPPRAGATGPVLFANYGSSGVDIRSFMDNNKSLSSSLAGRLKSEVTAAISGEQRWLTSRTSADELWAVEGWEDVLKAWGNELAELVKGLENKQDTEAVTEPELATYAAMVEDIRIKLRAPIAKRNNTDVHPLEAKSEEWESAAENLDKLAIKLSSKDEKFAAQLLHVSGRLRDILLKESNNARKRATVIAAASGTLWAVTDDKWKGATGIDASIFSIVREFIAADANSDEKRLAARKRVFANAAEGEFVVEAARRLEAQLAGLTAEQITKLRNKNGADAATWLKDALLQIHQAVELIEQFHAKRQANAPIVVPLLVTDGMERSFGSRTTLVMQQYSLALAAMLKYFSAAGESTYQMQDMLATVGNDYNSLFSVARISENSVRVRIGAMLQSTAQFAMVPQNRYVTMLLLVPKEVEPGEKINMLSHTSFVDCKTGEELPVGEEPPTVWWKPRFTSYFEPRFKDSLRAMVLSNNFPGFVSEFKAALADLRNKYEANSGSVYEVTLPDLNPYARVPAEAYAEQLWSQIVNQLGRAPYSSTQLQVPPAGRGSELPTLAPGDKLTAFDDGSTGCVIILSDAPPLPGDSVYAELEVKWEKHNTTPKGSTRIPLTGLAARANGRIWSLRFPTLKKLVSGSKLLHDIVVEAGDNASLTLHVYGADITRPQKYEVNYTYASPQPPQPAVEVAANMQAILLEAGQSDAEVILSFAKGNAKAGIALRFEDDGTPATGFISAAKVARNTGIGDLPVTGQTVLIQPLMDGERITLQLKSLQPGTVVSITVTAHDQRQVEFRLPVRQKPAPAPKDK